MASDRESPTLPDAAFGAGRPLPGAFLGPLVSSSRSSPVDTPVPRSPLLSKAVFRLLGRLGPPRCSLALSLSLPHRLSVCRPIFVPLPVSLQARHAQSRLSGMGCRSRLSRGKPWAQRAGARGPRGPCHLGDCHPPTCSWLHNRLAVPPVSFSFQGCPPASPAAPPHCRPQGGYPGSWRGPQINWLQVRGLVKS